LQGLRKKARHRSAKVDGSVESLLENIVGGKSPLKFPKGARVFSQGELANSMYFIQTGKVKVTVASTRGKNAVLALLGLRDFFGEGCLVRGTSARTSTATTLEPSTIFRIGKRAMLQALHIEPQFAETFLTAVLARNVNLEEDLCDQLFNHSEKRLARVLLKLSRFGPHDELANITVPRMNQSTLAEIVGTTRSRINVFMTKFRKLGLIQYRKGNTDIIIMAEALTNSVLRD
jgi:CRP/FNR family transcriptional regulator, cyclic AMP receptor protein